MRRTERPGRASMNTVVALALLATPALGRAEVTSIGALGFSVEHALETSAAPDAAYDVMTGEISRWWSGDHSWSGDATNLYFDARPGGCFCERLPQGGGVEHLRIVYLSPGKEIRLQGALGPLQEMGLQGAMIWAIKPSGDGSVLEWRYTVHGHNEGGFSALAPAVDAVIGEQLARLGALIDRD